MVPRPPNASYCDPMDEASRRGPITIVLADDHLVVRAGLRMLLQAEEGFEVVAEAGDVATTERRVTAYHPRVLILDLNMPGEPSLPAIPRLRQSAPDTQIVVLTMQNDPAFAREALRAGAIGYVLKEAAEGELVQAVRLAAEGRTYLNPGAWRAAGGGTTGLERPPRRSVGARDRGAPVDRARSHQHRDRLSAVPERSHGRVAPRSHPAEDRAHHTRGTRRLRPRARTALSAERATRRRRRRRSRRA